MASDIQTYLTKVLHSSEFQNSTKYQKLLEYLVNSTLEGNIPKELTIAMELFGMEMKDDTLGESNIRVYIHNVRKKLDSYYRNEGKTDKIQFKIPKGRYKVEFVKTRKRHSIFDIKSFIIIASALALLILADIFFLRINPAANSRIVKRTYSKRVWKDFMDNEVPLAVVIGDYYLLSDETYPDRSRFLRDVRINSESDFDNFLLENPEYQQTLSRTKHTFMGKYAPICIDELGRLMNLAGMNFKVILASEFQWQNLKNYNVIYIGSFKSLGMLGQLTKNSNFSFNVYPNELLFHELKSDSIFNYHSLGSDIDDAYETDYCVVTKLPVSSQQEVLMFLSVRDIGLIAAMDYFTNAETLKSFEKILGDDDPEGDYFEACFKIQGLDRNSMNIDLLHMNRLPTSAFFEMDSGISEGP
jgi:hypothetical protein